MKRILISMRAIPVSYTHLDVYKRQAHLIVMLGVPTAMVTGYLTTMQKLLRWHKNAPLGLSLIHIWT